MHLTLLHAAPIRKASLAFAVRIGALQTFAIFSTGCAVAIAIIITILVIIATRVICVYAIAIEIVVIVIALRKLRSDISRAAAQTC